MLIKLFDFVFLLWLLLGLFVGEFSVVWILFDGCVVWLFAVVDCLYFVLIDDVWRCLTIW